MPLLAVASYPRFKITEQKREKKIQPQLAPVGVNNETWLSDSWKVASVVFGWPDTEPAYEEEKEYNSKRG